MEENRKTVIQLEDVVFRYYENVKRNILDHVTMEIKEGGITVLMGSSGCGKSTLAAVSCGLLPENGGFLEQGSIRIYGQPLEEMTPNVRAEYVTMMFQNPDLQFCMDTLRKEMQFCMENRCVSASDMDQRMERAAADLGVTHLLDRKLHTLSGGEKQKAALCCLYVLESRCMILDEPFANIDARGTREIIEMLRLLQSKRQQTIIVIDHTLDHWLDIAQEIVLMGDGGQVVSRGITKDNLEDAKELFLQEGIAYPGHMQKKCAPGVYNQESMIELQDVKIPIVERKKKWGKKKEPVYLLENVSLSIPTGSMTAILGESGCGKTTLLLAMLKQHIYSGTISFQGKQLKQLKPKELFRQVGIVFQNPANQFVTQNVRQEVESSIRQWCPHIDHLECTKRADAMLEEYGLTRYHRYSPYMLSQGQQRRLAVLSVLAGKQKVLFLDEPTYGQDARSTKAIMEQLKRKVTKEGLTVIFTTHDQQLAHTWADRSYYIEEKKLQEEKYETGKS